MSVLEQRLLAVHDSLDAAHLPHAFGGAIALAYCTEEPRGTRDLDINVFVGPDRAADVFAALPNGVHTSRRDVEAAEREGQVRIWWDDTPLDLFFDVHAFHRDVAGGVRDVPFGAHTIPVLGCEALVVFKALFNRTRDWADIEDIAEARTVDMDEALGWLGRIVGPDDMVMRRLRTTLESASGSPEVS
jgi:hypothetical protein